MTTTTTTTPAATTTATCGHTVEVLRAADDRGWCESRPCWRCQVEEQDAWAAEWADERYLEGLDWFD